MSLENKLDLLTGNELYVVGDCMSDIYLTVDIRPCYNEPASIIYRSMKEVIIPGGAANVARNLVTLGNNVVLAGVLGYGEVGEDLKNVIHESRINFIPYLDSSRRTIRKIRCLKSRPTTSHLERIDMEFEPRDTKPIPSEIESAIMNDIEARKPEIIIAPDYAKGMFNGNLAQRIVQYAKASNCKLFATPKPVNAGKFNGSYLIGLNRSEAEEIYRMFGGKSPNPVAKEDLHNMISHNLDTKYVYITFGEEPMFSHDANEGYISEPPKVKKEVADTVGAGDTALAVVSLALYRGLSVREALIMANCAAGIVIEKWGTATVSIDELRERIRYFNH